MAVASASREFDWGRFFPLRVLFRALRLAMGMRALALSTLGLWFTFFGWAVCGKLFAVPADSPLNMVGSTRWPWQTIGASPHAWPRVVISWPENLPLAEQYVVAAWELLSRAFSLTLDPNLPFSGFVYLASCGFWALLVWSLFGGLVTRSAALGIAREEHLHWRPLLKFVGGRWLSIVGAPLYSMLGIALLAAPVAFLGFCMRFSAGMLLAGVLWPLAIVAGVVMALLAIGLLFGWPLMWAAVATEGADAFEAISRAYTYVFHRPLYYLLYAIEAVIVGAVGWLMVILFVLAVLNLSGWAASWGLGVDPQEQAASAELTAWAHSGGVLIRFWTGVAVSVAGAFSYSYLWNASTAIYFALRREVEATELDEVFIPEEAESPHGLPPLATDEAGVPKAPDEPAAARS